MSPIRVARSATQAKAPVLARRWLAQGNARRASPAAAPRDEAISPGLPDAVGFGSASPSRSAVIGLGFRIHERRKRSMIEGMRVLPKRGVVSNKALKPTRSAFLPLSGPRGLVQCCADLRCV